MMSAGKELAKAYYDGLKEAYCREGGQEVWDHFSSIVQGVSQADLDQLTALYPDIPESLVELLRLVDGTYFRVYGQEQVSLYALGSDVEEYPYYLLSARQMIETKDEFGEWADYFITREYGDGIPVDEGVCDDLDKLCWLHFSDCANNGGTSQLFIDFSPSAKGKKGQVLRYLHDPDEMAIIADSFDEYLQMLMENDYDFINEDNAATDSIFPVSL